MAGLGIICVQRARDCLNDDVKMNGKTVFTNYSFCVIL